MQDNYYKRAKEAFVTGLTGTNATEVFLAFALMPGAQWLYSEVLTTLEITRGRFLDDDSWNLPVIVLVEFAFLTLPNLIAFTYTDYSIPLLAVVYVSAGVLNQVGRRHAQGNVLKEFRKRKMNRLLEKEVSFVTSFRAQLLHLTCLAILAVDFTVFPRRFAKTETFGFSVMDIGVGGFIVSSAIVSPYARQSQSTHQEQSQDSVLKRMYNFFRPIVLVLLLGFARFATVKGVNYQEHVTEYGVHWNFYFTLAGVYLLFSALGLFGEWLRSPLAAVAISLVYENYLINYGGEGYIMDAPRESLLDQNREGVFSLAGYLAMYIFAVEIGRRIFAQLQNRRQAMHNLPWLALSLAVVSGLLWAAMVVCTDLLNEPSRRMVNVTYILWVMAQFTALLAVYAGIEIVCLSPRTPTLFAGESHNQLFVFLIANVATGGVNLGMRTIETPPAVAISVLATYMLLLSILASALEQAGIRIKL